MNDDQQTNAALDQRAEELAKAGDPDRLVDPEKAWNIVALAREFGAARCPKSDTLHLPCPPENAFACDCCRAIVTLMAKGLMEGTDPTGQEMYEAHSRWWHSRRRLFDARDALVYGTDE